MHLVNLRAHQRYGPVVRTGPNNLDLDLPALIKTVYSSDGRWRKTDFYAPASNVMDGRVVYNLFSLQDPVEHARQKRPVARHYSLAGVLTLESHVDETIRLLCRMLEQRHMPGCHDGKAGDETWGQFSSGFDVGEWIKMCTFWVLLQTALLLLPHPDFFFFPVPSRFFCASSMEMNSATLKIRKKLTALLEYGRCMGCHRPNHI